MSRQSEEEQAAFAALQELRSAPAQQAAPLISTATIVAYAVRTTALSDFRIEQAMRSAPNLRRVYHHALSQHAQAASAQALAAAEAQTELRIIGPYRLEILTEDDDMAWLVIRIPKAAPDIQFMELRGKDGTGARIALGNAVAGVIQLPLDPGFAEMESVPELLRDPATEIFLL
ncbi:MAG: hypothetical protein JJU24_12145 [Natronohydrobacter sp.]|nr:hypothetical protein [Natronohydrobacter sp.]